MRKTVLTLLGTTILSSWLFGFGAAIAFAEPLPCHCVDVPGLGVVSSVADLNVQLNDRYSTLDGMSFYRSPEQIEAYKLKLDAEKLRMGACPGSQGANPRWKVVLRGSTATNAPGPGTDMNYTAMTDIYSSMSSMGVDFSKSSVNQLANVISHQGYGIDPVPMAVFFKVANHPAGMSYDQALAAYGAGMSSAQKIAYAQYLGYLADYRYDHAKVNTLNRTIVPYNQVMDASSDQLKGGSSTLTAGDCADAANAQGHALQVLGMKNVYIVTWSTPQGLHTTVVSQDPSAKNTYYKLNWTRASMDSGKEGADLLRMPGAGTEWTNSGINYYISKVDGRTVAYVPTELGKVMAEAAGFNVHDIEPLARTTSSLAGAQLQLSGGRSVQAFTGRDSSGTLYAGLGMRQAWAQDTHFPGAVGMVAGVHSTADNINMGDLYVQLQQQVKTSDIKISQELKARIDASLIVMGSYGIGLNDPNFSSDTLGFDAGVLVNTGAQMTYGQAASAVSARVRAEAQFGGGLANMGGATPTPYLNHLMFSAEGRAKLGETPAGRAYLVAATAVLLDYFGPRLNVRVGVETPRVGMRFEVTGRLNDDTPAYKDGSLRRARAAIGIPLNDYLRVTVAGEIPLEQNGGHPTMLGTLDGRF